MDRRTDRWMDAWMCECVDGWKEGMKDGGMIIGEMDRCMQDGCLYLYASEVATEGRQVG